MALCVSHCTWSMLAWQPCPAEVAQLVCWKPGGSAFLGLSVAPASWCLRQLLGACVQAAALVLAAFVFGAASLELLGFTSGAVCWTAAGGSLETLWAGLGPSVVKMGCIRGQGAWIRCMGRISSVCCTRARGVRIRAGSHT